MTPTAFDERERLAGYLLAALLAVDTVFLGLDGGDGVVIVVGLAVAVALLTAVRFANRVVAAFVSVLAAFSPLFVGLAVLSLVFGGYLMVRTMQGINRANAVRAAVEADEADDDELPEGVDLPLRRSPRRR